MGLLNPNQRGSRGTQEDYHGSSNNNSTSSPSSPRSIHNSKKKCLRRRLSFPPPTFLKLPTRSRWWGSRMHHWRWSVQVVTERHARNGWREKIMWCILGIFRKTLYLSLARPCDVGCKFLPLHKRTQAEAAIGLRHIGETSGVLRSMESAIYYPDNDIATARRKGYDVVMTTSLSSDVPVGYFSWAEYDIMAPLQPKTEKALAAAYISNCGAINSRLQALEKLEKFNVKIDSYGACHHNRDENVDKLEALKHYKFSLAFENSNAEDYVTEKYFQSLVAGSVPVVYGAPNIQDFAPSPGSILHIKELNGVGSVAKTMKRLEENNTAYNEFLRWKHDGPSDSFKALVDMAAVHSDCRLCIFLATKIHEKEEKSLGFPKRPCKCTRGSESVHHLYIRERGRFQMESIFLRSGNLTMAAMESAVLSKFKSIKHETVWRKERPEKIRGEKRELKVYRIYPVGMTQRQALYTFHFKGISFRSHIESNPCAKFEVIFV
ncbi:glycoprotein 3-alpha-L-fucosyltransferase A isoform X2 [Cynara cardunculus var. scolymus]|uniref:glycoprotein 3-alpha-L-fucosyltransferase A isoform X2 n=1 Tax=Cynara cardunculus var. scolymus TaxID=59895 RepID=UPI000D62F4C9|nr:glycoprotein 3-alpha-L-fucosyltransferase A isoform X2 [Cynara cardunculus var. scolymus]